MGRNYCFSGLRWGADTYNIIAHIEKKKYIYIYIYIFYKYFCGKKSMNNQEIKKIRSVLKLLSPS
ncbi:MAG: hypothetical protein N7Q72_07030, partial [Spiroplasma sp. Tabriz.8]|nr:hypothetical protein [Spiroplasma sp. Tabriz.8]